MTGIERLRKEAMRWLALYDIESHGLLKIADQIERETLPRPMFDDGEPVQFGDEFEFAVGITHKVGAIKFGENGEYALFARDCGPSSWFGYSKCDRVKRPEPTDTWERLTADIERCGDSCAYFGRNCDDGGSACKGCPCHGADDACMVIVMRDVLGRAKRLAGVE